MGAFVKFTLSFLLLSALSSSSQTYEKPNLSPTSHLHANPSPSPPPLAPPTSYILALQWSSGFCSQPEKTCKPSFRKVFSIHGLWPSPVTTRQVAYQAPSPGLRATMEQDWLSLEAKTTNQIFWIEQWTKHGKDQLMSPEDYFQQGINLFVQNSANLLKSLQSSTVPPRLNQLYKRTAIKEALKTVYGAHVGIVCGIYRGSRSYPVKQHQQLVEIRIKYSAKFILQANPAVDDSCTDHDIYFNLL